MTQEEKDLLIKDLCARLPYRVKLGFYASATKQTYICTLLGLEPQESEPVIAKTENGSFYIWAGNVKPYLFPLSSITEEQCYELSSIRSGFQDCWKYVKTPIPLSICNFEQIDWFHKNHIDYRGLIEKGLAIDATKLSVY